MTEQITQSERKFLENLIKSIDSNKYLSHNLSFVISSSTMLLGLFVIIATWTMTLKNMIDRTIYFVFLPGTVMGLLLILTGVFVLKNLRSSLSDQQLTIVLKKLLKNT